jgi:DNA-binding GntR family transcriptional regulator
MHIIEKIDGSETDSTQPLHEQVYLVIRSWILTGRLSPGQGLTMRELSEMLGVSAMPVREAVRRLTSDRALHIKGNRRVEIPEMTPSRFEQIIFSRLQLEPELAVRALDHLTRAQALAIEEIDHRMDVSIEEGDSNAYMELNYQFHFSIYEKAECDVLTNLTESIWLQFGPFMRVAFERYRRSSLIDHHKAALDAIKHHDPEKLRLAIMKDINQGMSYIGEVATLNEETLRAANARLVRGDLSLRRERK